jgi:hypothetical protein
MKYTIEAMIRKYPENYNEDKKSFEFIYELITFREMMDFNHWKQLCIYDDKDEAIVIYYQD